MGPDSCHRADSHELAALWGADASFLPWLCWDLLDDAEPVTEPPGPEFLPLKGGCVLTNAVSFPVLFLRKAWFWWWAGSSL